MRSGDIIDGRFRVDRHHAEGGMGVVYRATDQSSGGAVAIKVVSVPTLEELGRFEREVGLLATLTHPGIVRYIAHGITESGSRYLVQEWIDGDTLHVRLGDEGLTVAETLELVHQVTLALAEAHKLGIVHRDIKPSNIMVQGEGDRARARVLDFGLARLCEPATRVTRTGTMVGTPGYMAPEQILGLRDVDASVDVFAVGCVLYRALSGHAPFAGRDPAAVRTKVLMCQPQRLDTLCDYVDSPLADLVLACLARSPVDRPTDAAELAARLGPLASAAPAGGPRITAAGRSAPTLALPTAILDGSDVAVVMFRDLSRDELTVTDTELEDMRTDMASALEPLGGDLQVLDAATAAFRISGPRTDCVARALEAALLLFERHPSAGVAVATATLGDIGGAIERASRAAEKAGMGRLFGQSGISGVYVDKDTAPELPDEITCDPRGDFFVVQPPNAERAVE